jgi:hypothetical protein
MAENLDAVRAGRGSHENSDGYGESAVQDMMYRNCTLRKAQKKVQACNLDFLYVW